MTLAEIEKLARAIDGFDSEAATEECRQQGEWPHCLACNGQYVVDIENEATALCHACAHETSAALARFVLRALPVLRAAEAYRDAKDFDTYEATALEQAVDAFRGGDK